MARATEWQSLVVALTHVEYVLVAHNEVVNNMEVFNAPKGAQQVYCKSLRAVHHFSIHPTHRAPI